MKFDHITNDTSQGPRPAWPACLETVVTCCICRSNSLSSSIVNATNTWDSRVDKGSRAVTEPIVGADDDRESES